MRNTKSESLFTVFCTLDKPRSVKEVDEITQKLACIGVIATLIIAIFISTVFNYFIHDAEERKNENLRRYKTNNEIVIEESNYISSIDS